MKNIAFAALLAAASASSSYSQLPTFTSTLVSSTCLSTLSKAYYGNSTSTEEDSYVYETDYVTNQDTLTMLSTVCSNDDCYVTTILNTLATVVTTVDGVLTTYVTASPYTVVYNDEITSTIPSSADITETSSSIQTTKTELIKTEASEAHASSSILSETRSLQGSVQSSLMLTTSSGISSNPSSDRESHATSALPSDKISVAKSSSVTEKNALTETSTVSQTTILTITRCADHKCQASTITTGVKEITSTIDGMETVFTTFCPLATEKISADLLVSSTSSETLTSGTTQARPENLITSKTEETFPTGTMVETQLISSISSATKSSSESVSSEISVNIPAVSDESSKSVSEEDFNGETASQVFITTMPDSVKTSASHTSILHSTIVTITSCKDSKCSATPVTTGVTYFTSTVSGTETVLTTFCPLSDIHTVSAVKSVTVSHVASSSNSGPSSERASSRFFSTVTTPAENTVNVITNNILTQSKTVASTMATSIATGSTLMASVSSYEGGASRALPLVIALPLMYLFF